MKTINIWVLIKTFFTAKRSRPKPPNRIMPGMVKTWITADGTRLQIQKMTDDHLMNAIHYTQRVNRYQTWRTEAFRSLKAEARRRKLI